MNRPLPEQFRLPHPERLDPARADFAGIIEDHETAMAAGQEGYQDARTGYLVFTAQALWERGYCCDSGCRHCPYIARPG